MTLKATGTTKTTAQLAAGDIVTLGENILTVKRNEKAARSYRVIHFDKNAHSGKFQSNSKWDLMEQTTPEDVPVAERTGEQNEAAKASKTRRTRKGRKTTPKAQPKGKGTKIVAPKVGKGKLTAPDEDRTYNQILADMIARGYDGPKVLSTKFELLAREAQMPNS